MADGASTPTRTVTGFTNLMLALASVLAITGWWLYTAHQASGIKDQSWSTACEHFNEHTTDGTIVGAWQWTPPGLTCTIETNDNSTLFVAPTWSDVLIPSIIGALIVGYTIYQTLFVLFRAALSTRGRKVATAGLLLVLSEILTIVTMPIAYEKAGALGTIATTLSILVAAATLTLAWHLLLPKSATIVLATPPGATPEDAPITDATAVHITDSTKTPS